ncbi:hypothetical protein, partial [Brevundimonas sp.]|uniref:hypothetical protein n=1 Tax=Brevundimonas sp. TaxID=1871086 RepID=UPI002ED86B83
GSSAADVRGSCLAAPINHWLREDYYPLLQNYHRAAGLLSPRKRPKSFFQALFGVFEHPVA